MTAVESSQMVEIINTVCEEEHPNLPPFVDILFVASPSSGSKSSAMTLLLLSSLFYTVKTGQLFWQLPMLALELLPSHQGKLQLSSEKKLITSKFQFYQKSTKLCYLLILLPQHDRIMVIETLHQKYLLDWVPAWICKFQ